MTSLILKDLFGHIKWDIAGRLKVTMCSLDNREKNFMALEKPTLEPRCGCNALGATTFIQRDPNLIFPTAQTDGRLQYLHDKS